MQASPPTGESSRTSALLLYAVIGVAQITVVGVACGLHLYPLAVQSMTREP